SLDTADMQGAISVGASAATSEQPLHDVSCAHGSPPSADPPPASVPPLEDPLLDPLDEPLEDPLLEPLEDPLEDPLLEPLLDPLEDPLLELLLLELSVASASPPPEPVLPPLLPLPPNPPVPLLDEHAASNPKTPPDAHTNLLIFSIDASSSESFPHTRKPSP
ncbi:MAG: hypothetical protein ACLP1X_21370, partial [Polyangiaceae bacterium]